MNENSMVDNQLLPELLEDVEEFSAPDTGNSENNGLNSIDSSDNNSSVSDAQSVAATTVIPETYYSAELGGYPVVIVNDITDMAATVADADDYYSTLSTAWIDYFSGVLANMGNCDYLAYCLREYTNTGYNSYIEHYVLFYDIEIDENDAIVSGQYPYIDIYRENNSSAYVQETGMSAINYVPFPGYGSFGSLSDIRQGVTANNASFYAFAIGFAVVYSICTHIFNYIIHLRGKR